MKPRGIFRGGAIVGIGVVVSQAINILSYPILSRLFTPEDFGAFSLFFFGMQVLGASLAGRYEQAIMLCRTPTRAHHALSLAQVTALLATGLLVALFGLFAAQLDALTDANLGAYWMAVPIAGFFVSVQTSLTFLAVRYGQYGLVSTARIVKSAAAFLIQIVLVYSIWGGVGALIAGETLGAALSILPVLRAERTRGQRSIFHTRRGRRHALRLAAVYVDQPLWNLPHVFISQLARWVMAMMIAALYTTADAGAYFMMFRVVMMPSTLVSGSLSQVFFRAAAEEQRATGRFTSALKSVVLPLLGLGLLATLVLMLLGPWLFAAVLGEQWRSAGEMAVIFAPYMVLQMVLATVAPSYLLGGRQRSMLGVASLQTAVFLVGFWLGHVIMHDIRWAIGASVWLSVPYMAGMLLWYWRMARTRMVPNERTLNNE
ncbi:oligosaccharide flippase family protein [Frigidibacter mobilis]|uniref:O-antigen translocase n=1 Tax=Frigidibacter mobilis TaxID=1335048 RepID=A0A159Z5M3_9RHOB|nr:oligosaccharide flippase family protein [Frigidibacter mobilis]AMY70567.1 O-antigen translocase [Frigidibacter mobilis]